MILVCASTAWSIEPVVDMEREMVWKERHTAEIDDSDMLTLAQDGEPKTEIVIAERAPPVVQLAAEELKTFLERATGAEFKIVTKRTKGLAAFILGNRDETRSIAKIDVDSFPLDAFRIRRVGDVLFIAGTDGPGQRGSAPGMGTLYGVYEFLERFVGVRF